MTTPYIDRDGLVARITESDLAQRLAAPDGEGKLAQAIIDANSTGDLYLGSRNALPLAVVPPALSALVAAIALALFGRATGGATEAETKAEAAALAVLAQLASGALLLGQVGGAATATGARLTSGTRRMTRDSLAGVL